MEGDGLRAEGEFFVLFGLCQEQLEKHVLQTALFSLFSTRANHEGGEVFILCPGLNKQLVIMVTADWHFLCCHVFPVVSELDYLLLEHVVIKDDLDFCL